MEDEKRTGTLRDLASLNDMRFEEELTRPRVESWGMYDPWVEWVGSHRRKGKSGGEQPEECGLPEFRNSPLCGHGIH